MSDIYKTNLTYLNGLNKEELKNFHYHYQNSDYWSIYEYLLRNNIKKGHVWEWVQENLKPKKTWISHFESIKPLNVAQGVLTKFGFMPQEIIQAVISYLPSSEMIQCRHVCKSINVEILKASFYSSYLKIYGFKEDGMILQNLFHLINLLYLYPISKQDKKKLYQMIQHFYQFQYNASMNQSEYRTKTIYYMTWFSSFSSLYSIRVFFSISKCVLPFLKICQFTHLDKLYITHSHSKADLILEDFSISEMIIHNDFHVCRAKKIHFTYPFVVKFFGVRQEMAIDVFINLLKKCSGIETIRIDFLNSLKLDVLMNPLKTHFPQLKYE